MANASNKNETTSFQSSQYSSCEDFRHLLTQLCEEVCFLRMTKKESDERVRHLVADQHKHERQLEEEILKNSTLKEKHVQEQADLDRSYKDEIQHLQREKNKLIWENESWERNVKSVKDEVRTLQLEKYNLERMIREQSHCLKTHVTASSSHMKQATDIETTFKEMKQLVERCNTQVTNLSKEVKEAIVLNKRLSFINSHHNCETRDLEAKLESMEKIICELEIRNKTKEAGAYDGDDAKGSLQMKQELAVVQEQLIEMKSNEAILQEQLDQSRERNKEIIAQYEEAQKLVEQHLVGNERHKNHALEVELENRKIREEVENLQEALKEGGKRQTKLKEEIEQLNTSISSKENQFRTEISALREETEYLLKTSGILREKNASLEKKHTEALARITLLQEELNKRQVLKIDSSTLTDDTGTEEEFENCILENSPPVVNSDKPSLTVKNEAVLVEPLSPKDDQQMLVEDCNISAPNLTIKTIPQDQVQQKNRCFGKTPLTLSEVIFKSDRQNTQDTFTRACGTADDCTHNSDDDEILTRADNNLSPSKLNTCSSLLDQTTEIISPYFEETKKDISNVGFEKMPTGVIVTEHLATTPMKGDVTVSNAGITFTDVKGKTHEVTIFIEGQDTQCKNNHDAIPVVPKNAAEGTGPVLSSDNVILRMPEEVKVSEEENDVEIKPTDTVTSYGAEKNQMVQMVVIDGSRESGGVIRNEEQVTHPSSAGRNYANDSHQRHGCFSNVTTVHAAFEEASLQVDQIQVNTTNTCLSKLGTSDEGTRPGNISALENVIDQEQINITVTTKESSVGRNIFSDSGNVSCPPNECSKLVTARTSVTNRNVANSQNNTHESCSNKATKLPQHLSASNHVMDTTVTENFTTGRIFHLCTVTGDMKSNDICQAASLEKEVTQSSKSSLLPLDIQMSEKKNRPYVTEDTKPPSPKRQCLEHETPTADEVNSVSVALDDNNDHPLPATTLKPLNITYQQDIGNSASFTSEPHVSDIRAKDSSEEKMPRQKKVQGTPEYENLSRRLKINTPEKQSASFIRLNPRIIPDSLLRQYSTLSYETKASAIKPIVTTQCQAQCISGKSLEKPVTSHNMLPLSQPVPQSHFMFGKTSISPNIGVVDLQDSIKRHLENSCEESESTNQSNVTSAEEKGLCDIRRSDGRHPAQPGAEDICTVSWSGKGCLIPPTKVSPQNLAGCEPRIHVASKGLLSQPNVKLHDVLKVYPFTAGQAVEILPGTGPLTLNKKSNSVSESFDHQLLGLPLRHKYPESSSGVTDSASQCDNESGVSADSPAVQPKRINTLENAKSALTAVEQNLSKKQHASDQDPHEKLFSDDDEEEDDISSTLTKEIERAQSILNRNRLKKTRRCKHLNN